MELYNFNIMLYVLVSGQLNKFLTQQIKDSFVIFEGLRVKRQNHKMVRGKVLKILKILRVLRGFLLVDRL